MIGFLLLGFLIGMAHALEADHLAAIGTMSVDTPRSQSRMAWRGAAWGLGHTVTLFIIGSLVILLGLTITDRLASALEFCVGLMLVLLGADTIRRFRQKKIHFHSHDHGDGHTHIHAHSHLGETDPHAQSSHHHNHPTGFPIKAFWVGLVHGAAGSAGLLALAVATTQSWWVTCLYILLFGIGSICGMAALTWVAAWPLKWASQRMNGFYKGLTCIIAMIAIVIGGTIIHDTLPTLLGT